MLQHFHKDELFLPTIGYNLWLLMKIRLVSLNYLHVVVQINVAIIIPVTYLRISKGICYLLPLGKLAVQGGPPQLRRASYVTAYS